MDQEHIKLYIDDRPGEGIFRVHRDAYADADIFELEMKYIFERTWNYLAIESEIAKPNDFVTRHIGRTPVIVSRDAKGRIGAFINACRHKGATVCRLEEGNAKYHVCPYHGWAYDASGKNVDIKDRAAGSYAPAFDAENHDLVRLAKLGSYKGMILGSLSPDVPPLEEYLGDLKFFIDVHMEHGPQGMEVIPGRALYTYRGNWKMQLENVLDPYHFTTTHAVIGVIQQRRSAGQGHRDGRNWDWQKRDQQQGGTFEFRYGHAAGYTGMAEPEKRPIYPVREEIEARVGKVRAEWMFKQRNAVLFPNLQISDAVTPILRTFRPISVDYTELRSYVLAPVGERPELRAWRLRQFEDTVNPGGFATPDDATVYTECQNGMKSTQVTWLNAYERGIAARQEGANEVAREMGIRPVGSVNGMRLLQQETGTHAPWREWLRLMDAGLSGRKAFG
jgi:benzoate/toluate 1,2-dioxygenase alpha subunit